MKTLDQIEARTPISTVPYTITAGGSYYLTTNVTAAAGTHGIIIQADDVTIDLNGFALIGGGGFADGIHVPSQQRNLLVRNGTIRNWGNNGADFGNTSDSNSQFEHLRVSNNGANGLVLGPGGSAIACVSESNGVWGFYSGADATIIGCVARANNSHGIAVFSGSLVKDCRADANGAFGIQLSGGDDVAILGCVVRNNGSAGINAGNRCIVKDCTVAANVGDGIVVANNCLVAGDLSCTNGTAGINASGRGNRIEDNNCRDNGQNGIRVTLASGHNVIIKNAAGCNSGGNYNIAAGNDLGPTNSPAAAATSPWANFSY